MAINTQLSQDEIDRLFREAGTIGVEEARSPAKKFFAYDFRRPDRIPKEQLRSIHLLHDFFARNLASSLGAYLRAYVVVHLVSVEQLSFAEFLQDLPTPTCISTIGMKPLDGKPWEQTAPMIYDSINYARNASDPLLSLPNPGRHEGYNVIGYADGHAKHVAPK